MRSRGVITSRRFAGTNPQSYSQLHSDAGNPRRWPLRLAAGALTTTRTISRPYRLHHSYLPPKHQGERERAAPGQLLSTNAIVSTLSGAGRPRNRHVPRAYCLRRRPRIRFTRPRASAKSPETRVRTWVFRLTPERLRSGSFSISLSLIPLTSLTPAW